MNKISGFGKVLATAALLATLAVPPPAPRK